MLEIAFTQKGTPRKGGQLLIGRGPGGETPQGALFSCGLAKPIAWAGLYLVECGAGIIVFRKLTGNFNYSIFVEPPGWSDTANPLPTYYHIILMVTLSLLTPASRYDAPRRVHSWPIQRISNRLVDRFLSTLSRIGGIQVVHEIESRIVSTDSADPARCDLRRFIDLKPRNTHHRSCGFCCRPGASDPPLRRFKMHPAFELRAFRVASTTLRIPRS